MKETKELFANTEKLINIDNYTLEQLISLQNTLQNFIQKVTIAKENAYYFELGPETPLYTANREQVYDKIYSQEEYTLKYKK